jgi:hypothetical protein
MINFFTVVPFGESHVRTSDVSFDLVGSGHAMVFYSVAVLVNWAAVKRREEGIDRVCERGHRLSPCDEFCSECGAPAKKREEKTGGAAWGPGEIARAAPCFCNHLSEVRR